MAFLRTLSDQLKTLWQRWTLTQRIGISAATAVSVIAVIATFAWATRAEYVVLASQLTPQQAAEMVGVLETEQIDTQLNYSGSAISVPRSDVSRARLALKDVWEPSADADAGVAGAFPGSPREEEDRRRRQLEVRIARSIEKIRGIRTATVHVSRPDPSPFVSDQAPATASVIVDAASGSVTPGVAESIIALTARAVEGLLPEQITLTDTEGRQFHSENGIGSSLESNFAHKRRVELELESKAESMLAVLLGHGNAVVRVTADIDFRETTRTDRKFDPDGKVKSREEIETIKQTGGVIPNGGVGAATNVLANNLTQNGETAKYDKEIISSEYENASTEEIVRDIPGKITRLTVAAIVDLTPPADPAAADPAADPAASTPAAPSIDPTQIEAIVRQAVGLDETRGDEIQVMTASLNDDLEEPASGVMTMWQQYEPIIHTVGMGAIACGAFLMSFLLLRKLKPVTVTETTLEPQLSLAEVQHLAALSEQAKNNPEVAAKILESWLGNQDNDDADVGPRYTAKAA